MACLSVSALAQGLSVHLFSQDLDMIAIKKDKSHAVQEKREASLGYNICPRLQGVLLPEIPA